MSILLLFIIPLLVYSITKNLIMSIIVNSCVFILVIAMLQHYFISFPMYVIITGIIFLLHYKEINFGNSKFNIIYIAYMIVMLFISFFYNYYNFKDILAVFFINLLFPFIYLYLDNTNKEYKINKNQLIYLLFFTSIFELLVSVILSILSTTHQAIINHQPIGGGLAVGLLPLLIYLLSHKECNKPILILTSIIFSISVILSGLRGYLLIYFGTFLVYIIINFKSIIQILYRKVYLTIFLILSLTLVISIFGSSILDIANSQLRINESLGRRNFENQYVVKLIASRGIIDNLFGQGIGMKMSEIQSVYNFNFYVNNNPKYFNDYEYRSEALDNSISFHNVWATIVVQIGFIGLFLYVYLFIYLIKNIFHCHNYCQKEKIVLVAYILLLALALFFRETLFCCVLEMISLYFAINIKHHDISEEKHIT